jgi:hypothetical protein
MLRILPEERLIDWILEVILFAGTMNSVVVPGELLSKFAPETKILKRFSVPDPITVAVDAEILLELLVANAYTSWDAFTELST